MSSWSPPTRRVVDVVEFLVQRGEQRCRLSDVARELDLNQATAYAILQELCAGGWTTRDPSSKTFTIGPAFVAMARQLEQTRPLTRSCSAAAQALAGETGFAASVSERLDDVLVVVDFVSAPDAPFRMSPGEQLPFAAPFGPCFAAWDVAEQRDHWVARSGVENATLAAQLEDYLNATRDRGFSVERMSAPMARTVQAMLQLHAEDVSDSMRAHINGVLSEITTAAALSPDGQTAALPVGALTAPVFDRHGRAALNVGVHPFRELTAKQILHIGGQVARHAQAISVAPPAPS